MMPHLESQYNTALESPGHGALINEEKQTVVSTSMDVGAKGLRNVSTSEEDLNQGVFSSPCQQDAGLSSLGTLLDPDVGRKSDNASLDYNSTNGQTLQNGTASRTENDKSNPETVRDSAKGLGLFPFPRPDDVKMMVIQGETQERSYTQANYESKEDKKKEQVLKLSPAQIYELTSSPKSLPIEKPFADILDGTVMTSQASPTLQTEGPDPRLPNGHALNSTTEKRHARKRSDSATTPTATYTEHGSRDVSSPLFAEGFVSTSSRPTRPHMNSRTVSTPPMRRKRSPSKESGPVHGSMAHTKASRSTPAQLQLDNSKLSIKTGPITEPMASPMPSSIPLPPLSIPTYLQLELSSYRPSPLYIHRSATSDFPYESSRVKLDRLLNFLLLPPQLEEVLWFGTLACLDAWLYSFTILPLRFFKALYILGQFWGRNLIAEIGFIAGFVYTGTGRMWRRRRRNDDGTRAEVLAPVEGLPSPEKDSLKGYATKAARFESTIRTENTRASPSQSETTRKHHYAPTKRHRRAKSTPSLLLPDHKADILKGLLIVISCTILMYFDASRMYHGIRGQAAIKLYVIYNVLEVCKCCMGVMYLD